MILAYLVSQLLFLAIVASCAFLGGYQLASYAKTQIQRARAYLENTVTTPVRDGITRMSALTNLVTSNNNILTPDARNERFHNQPANTDDDDLYYSLMEYQGGGNIKNNNNIIKNEAKQQWFIYDGQKHYVSQFFSSNIA
jgi:hypothetical protein